VGLFHVQRQRAFLQQLVVLCRCCCLVGTRGRFAVEYATPPSSLAICMRTCAFLCAHYSVACATCQRLHPMHVSGASVRLLPITCKHTPMQCMGACSYTYLHSATHIFRQAQTESQPPHALMLTRTERHALRAHNAARTEGGSRDSTLFFFFFFASNSAQRHHVPSVIISSCASCGRLGCRHCRHGHAQPVGGWLHSGSCVHSSLVSACISIHPLHLFTSHCDCVHSCHAQRVITSHPFTNPLHRRISPPSVLPSLHVCKPVCHTHYHPRHPWVPTHVHVTTS
jgi:hypothetical protein